MVKAQQIKVSKRKSTADNTPPPAVLKAKLVEARDAYDAATAAQRADAVTLHGFLDAHWRWSRDTFGGEPEVEPILRNIDRALDQMRSSEEVDAAQWTALVTLAIDGALRSCISHKQLARMLCATLAENRAREWPKRVKGEQAEHMKPVEEGLTTTKLPPKPRKKSASRFASLSQ